MCHIHLDVFIDDSVKAVLRHTVDLRQCLREVEHRGKAKMSFGDVDRARLPCKVIYILKQIAVNLLQSGVCANGERLDDMLVIEFLCTLFGQPLLLMGKSCGIRDSEFVGQCHDKPPNVPDSICIIYFFCPFDYLAYRELQEKRIFRRIDNIIQTIPNQ